MDKKKLFEMFVKYTTEHKHDFEEKQKNIIRIMTFNVHCWKNMYNKDTTVQIFSLLEESNADIICLEEALFFEKKIKEKIFKNCNELGYKYIIPANERYGINLLLSKHPIIEHSIIILEKSNIDNHYRYAIKAHISINNKILKIVGTHLDICDETESLRLRQIKKIVHETDDEFLILGDLNSLRKCDYDEKHLEFINKSNELRDIKTVYLVTDFLKLCCFKDSFSFLGNFPIISVWSCRRVDYIYVGNGFNHKIKSSNIYPTLVSDHYPVYCDIKLK